MLATESVTRRKPRATDSLINIYNSSEQKKVKMKNPNRYCLSYKKIEAEQKRDMNTVPYGDGVVHWRCLQGLNSMRNMTLQKLGIIQLLTKASSLSATSREPETCQHRTCKRKR